MQIKITKQPGGLFPDWFKESLVGLEFPAKEIQDRRDTILICCQTCDRTGKCYMVTKEDLTAVLEQNGLQKSLDYLVNELKLSSYKGITISINCCE